MARLHHHRHHQLPTFILFEALALLLLFTYQSGVSAEECKQRGKKCSRDGHCCCLDGTATNVLLSGAVQQCKPRNGCIDHCVCDTNNDCPGNCCCGVGPTKVALCVSPTVCKDRLHGACRCKIKRDCPNPACCCRKDYNRKSYGTCQAINKNQTRNCPADKPTKDCRTVWYKLFELDDH